METSSVCQIHQLRRRNCVDGEKKYKLEVVEKELASNVEHSNNVVSVV